MGDWIDTLYTVMTTRVLSWNSLSLSSCYLTAATHPTLRGAAARGALTFFRLTREDNGIA